MALEAVEASEVAEVAEVNEAGEDSKALKITTEDFTLSGFTDIRSTMKTPDIFKYLSILDMNSGDR